MRSVAPWILRFGSLVLFAGFFLPTFQGCGRDHSPAGIARSTPPPKDSGEAVDAAVLVIWLAAPSAVALLIGVTSLSRGRAAHLATVGVFFTAALVLAVTGSILGKSTRGVGSSWLWGSASCVFLWFLAPVGGASVVGAMLLGAAPLERCARTARLVLSIFLVALYALLLAEFLADGQFAPRIGIFVDLAGALLLVAGAALDRPGPEASWEPSSESSAAPSS